MRQIRTCRGPTIVVFFVLILLTACSVKLVSDYDDQIDAGLTQLNTDLNVFVTNMAAAAGTPEGRHAVNKDFYTTQKAKLDTLIVRAQAHKTLNSCPGTDVVAAAVAHIVPASTANEYLSKIPSDDCSVVLLQLTKDAFIDLERFHIKQAEKGMPASAAGPILIGGVGSLIRSGIAVEIAKKSGKSVGGKDGS